MCWHILRWAKDVTFHPKKLTKKDLKYGEFIKRLLIVSLIPGILSTVIAVVTFDFVGAFVFIPVFLIAAVVTPFVNAAILHFFGKWVFRLMKKDYKKTYNSAAYSMAPRFLFAWIPVVGGIIAFIWGFIAQVYALANQQNISARRALLVMLIPIIVALIVMFAVGATFLGSMFALMGEAPPFTPEII